jgi:hypothetical protein
MLYSEEISMIVSSDPVNGAVNRSADGSAFEIQFNGDPLTVPRDAINVNVKVEEATVWWVVPNIEENVNNKMFISGDARVSVESSIELGFGPTDQIGMIGGGGTALLSISNTIGIDPPMPVGAFVVGDSIIFNTGPLVGNQYTIVSVNLDGTTSKLYEVVPSTDSLASGVNSFSRFRPGGEVDYTVDLPTGLYDLSGLNNAIQRGLEALGARTDPSPLITLSPDESTQRVALRLNYPNVVVDFEPDGTPYQILGFDRTQYGPASLAPVEILAPRTAAFNTVNYFLIQSDLVQRGIRFNSVYNQVIAQVLINVLPGSQIISNPYNPAKTNAQELAGTKRSNLRFRLTDDRGRPVNTNSEYWSARIVIEYQRPLMLDVEKHTRL